MKKTIIFSFLVIFSIFLNQTANASVAQDMFLKAKATYAKGFSATLINSDTSENSGNIALKYNPLKEEYFFKISNQEVSFIQKCKKLTNKCELYLKENNIVLEEPFDLETQEDMGINLEEAFYQKLKYIGDKTINGQLCAGFSYTENGETEKFWINKSNGMTIRVELSGESTTFTNIRFGISDTEFTIPATAKRTNALLFK